MFVTVLLLLSSKGFKTSKMSQNMLGFSVATIIGIIIVLTNIKSGYCSTKALKYVPLKYDEDTACHTETTVSSKQVNGINLNVIGNELMNGVNKV